MANVVRSGRGLRGVLSVAAGMVVVVSLAGCGPLALAKLDTGYETLQAQSLALQVGQHGTGQTDADIVCTSSSRRYIPREHISPYPSLPAKYAGYAPRFRSYSSFLRAE